MRRDRIKELRLEAAHLRRKAADILEHGSVILEKSRQLKTASQQRVNARSKAHRRNEVKSAK